MSSDQRSGEVRAYLLEHPQADRAQVMRALGVSARLVARVEAELDDSRFARRARRRRRLVVSVTTLVLCTAALVVSQLLPGAEKREAVKVHSSERAHAERDLYAALDAKDPSRLERAVQELGSPDEGVRIAALRYLMGVGVMEPRSLGLIDDCSPRVRLAAMHLLCAQSVTLPGLEDRLAAAALDGQRELAERLVALDGLHDRARGEGGRALVEVLVPLSGDSQPAIRARVEALLQAHVGKAPPPSVTAPGERVRAWRGLLERGA